MLHWGFLHGGYHTLGGIYGEKKIQDVRLFAETFVSPQCNFPLRLPLHETAVIAKLSSRCPPAKLKYYLPQSESDWSKLLLWICWLGLGRVSFCARTKTTRTSPRFFVPSEPLHQKCELRFPGPCRLVEPSGTKSIPNSELRFGASANMRNQVEPNPEPNQFTIVS